MKENLKLLTASLILALSLLTPQAIHCIDEEREKESVSIARNPIFSNLQKTIGYEFKNHDLLICALRHSGADNGHTPSSRGNQGLEFLGDAVLKLIIINILWTDFPHLYNGELLHTTCLKLVGNDNLAPISDYLKLTKISQELKLLPKSIKDIAALRPKGRADFVESLIAAIYEDGGLDASKAFVLRYWRGAEAPKNFKDTFKNLDIELKTLQSKGSGQPSQLPSRRDNSWSFLGDGVLTLVLKNYLYRQFPEATEGVLHKKYEDVSSNKAIEELYKALDVEVSHSCLKRMFGRLYLNNGLEKTSEYILSVWTSDKAPHAIKEAFSGDFVRAKL